MHRGCHEALCALLACFITQQRLLLLSGGLGITLADRQNVTLSQHALRYFLALFHPRGFFRASCTHFWLLRFKVQILGNVFVIGKRLDIHSR